MAEWKPAASALVVRGDRILFVRSTRTQQLWAFPGGRQENGETPEQTAIREVREEVGLDVEVTAGLGTYIVAGSGFKIDCFVATATNMDMKVDASEILEARWCSLKEGLALNLVSTAREALERYSNTTNTYQYYQ